MTRVLFIRFSSIGDVVLTAPAVAALRAAVKGPCEVHFLVRAAFAPVVAGFGPLVDVVHETERTGRDVLPALRAAGFDQVIDLQSNARSRRVTRALGVPASHLTKLNPHKLLLVLGFLRHGVSPIVERYISAVADAFPDASLPDGWPLLFEDAALPAGFDATEPWSVIALGAAHPFKALPEDLVRAVIDATPGRVVLLGGPAERELGESLGASFQSAESWAGQTSIAESAALIRGARAVLAADTGMMHLAAALGRPVVTVWGCTRPSLGMAAWRPAEGSANVLPIGRGDQRPCSKLGNRCRYKSDPGCVHHIHPVEALKAWRSAQ
jgi:ADP-heptose:LPS heptosyltransferase